MNPKQRAFVAEYLKDKNATQAAIRAGYSKASADVIGPRLLGNVRVKVALGKALEAREKRTLVDADYIVTSAKEILERCLQKKPVMEFDRQSKSMMQATNGDGEGIWEFDSAGANGALKLLASHVRGFVAPQKIEASGPDGEALVVKIIHYGAQEK